MKSILLGLALLVSLPARAFGFGEVFKIETSGTEYCGNFDFARFNSGNNIDLWVRIESDTELSVSLTSNFDPVLTFPMFGRTYLTSASGAAFVAGVLFEDGAYATIQGAAKFDRRTGDVSSLKGTFIQNEVFFLGCFSSGKFASQRIS